LRITAGGFEALDEKIAHGHCRDLFRIAPCCTVQLRFSDQDRKNTMRRNAKRARREVLFILRSAFLCHFSASRVE
jgi:hypothetical protein